MSTNELIIAEEFCSSHNIGISLIQTFHDSGLLEIVTIEKKVCIPEQELPQLEKLVHFYEMGINVEGIEAVTHLLQQLASMQQEIRQLHNRLHGAL